MTHENAKLPEDFVQLARIALAGRSQDIQLLIHRASKRYRTSFPEMTDSLLNLLKESPSRSSPLRKQADIPLPVDLDSRLQLLRVETTFPDHKPILSAENDVILAQVLSERKESNALRKLGLQPTKSMLFNGPPGVGKTLAARWVASELKRPLLILDLAAVMSSFLGRTGNNIRYVLDYAKNMECVLLLDEFDAIAKRRDDTGEIGELKRLVTVLLQEIDDWPPTGLLLAATNHPDLLDPAVWRRFEVVLAFGVPDKKQVEFQIHQLLEEHITNSAMWSKILPYVLNKKSYSEVERQVMLLRKTAAVTGKPLEEVFNSIIIGAQLSLTKDERKELGTLLYDSGFMSQRQARQITGLSRDTIRKYSQEPPASHTKNGVNIKKTATKKIKKKYNDSKT